MSIQAGVHEKGSFLLQDMLCKLKSGGKFQKIGAIGVFVGVVRGETLKGKKVTKLMLEAYEEKANEVLRNICSDLRKERGIVDVQIHHMLGEFNVGEDIVYVLVAGSHRKNVFPILQEAVERYKKEAPIFKKEYIVDKKGNTRGYWVTERKRVT